MTTIDIAQPKVEPKRDRWGRYVIPVDGKPKALQRVTTFAGLIEERYNLEKWGRRMVVRGILDRKDLYAQAAANHDDDKKLNAICEDALEAAKGGAGANLGTALHTFTERVDRGETINIPEPWDADVAAYTKTLAEGSVHILPEYIEQIVVNHTFELAGTFDRLVRIDGFDLPVIADLKTGGVEFAWGAIAVQLAAYAYSDELYDPVTDTTSPMPDVDHERGLVIHLPAGTGTCTLYEVDIAAGWATAQLCAGVREWRKRKNLAKPIASATVPTAHAAPSPVDVGERRAYLVSRVELLRDEYPDALPDLATCWPMGVATFKQTDQHTAEDLELIALAISTVEAKHRVEFGVDPADRRAAPETIDTLVARLKKLPADIAATIAETVNGQVPHLRSGKFTVTHASILEPHVTAGEQAAIAAYSEASKILTELADGDKALIDVLVATCTTDAYTWTRQQLDILRAVYTAVDACHLAFGEDVDGRMTLTAVDGEKKLLDRLGARKDAVATCKEIAETFGLATPRLLSDVVANPALYALAVTSAPTTSISESQESAA